MLKYGHGMGKEPMCVGAGSGTMGGGGVAKGPPRACGQPLLPAPQAMCVFAWGHVGGGRARARMVCHCAWAAAVLAKPWQPPHASYLVQRAGRLGAYCCCCCCSMRASSGRMGALVPRSGLTGGGGGGWAGAAWLPAGGAAAGAGLWAAALGRAAAGPGSCVTAMGCGQGADGSRGVE